MGFGTQLFNWKSSWIYHKRRKNPLGVDRALEKWLVNWFQKVRINFSYRSNIIILLFLFSHSPGIIIHWPSLCLEVSVSISCPLKVKLFPRQCVKPFPSFHFYHYWGLFVLLDLSTLYFKLRTNISSFLAISWWNFLFVSVLDIWKKHWDVRCPGREFMFLQEY